MDFILAIISIALLTFGFIGQAFEMRKIRTSSNLEDPSNIFTNKKNFKWYGIIIIAIVLWFIAERS